MSLPKAVQEGLNKATAIQQTLAGQQPTPASAIPELGTVAKPAPPELVQPQTPAREQPQEPQPAPSLGDEETWEQRYKSYKGTGDRLFEENKRLSAELDRAARANDGMRTELQNLKEQVEKLANPPEPVPELPKGATEDDFETFGVDQVRMVERVSAKAASDTMMLMEAKIQGILSALDELRGNVNAVDERSVMTAEQAFLRDLRIAVPDVMEVNAMPDFKVWLSWRDPMSGRTRQEMLADAQAKMDVDRVALIFNNFKQHMSGQATATTEAPAGQVNNPLAGHVSPPRSKSTSATSTSSDGQPKIWTQAEISAVYDGIARGRIVAEERKALEMEINAAIRTNRVR